tara:strand:- start:350 stop:472 length:123 start_codon:yes stop_codon:yes gene_type:complete
MVQIDKKVQEVIAAIKAEESRIANRENAINNAAPSISIAT